MNNNSIDINDQLAYDEKHQVKGLRGHIQILRQNMETGEF